MENGLQINYFANMEELNQHMASDLARERYILENVISETNRDKEEFYLYGFCECCNFPAKFILDWKYCHTHHINFRERLVCTKCSLNNRQRSTFSYVKNLIDSKPDVTVYLYEQVTPLFNRMVSNMPHVKIIGSEYLGYDKKPGEVINGIRHEDAMQLSFADKSIDIIVSNEVYEHVPDVDLCFKEAARVLKDDGKLIFTIPFYYYYQETTKRADLINGKLVILKEEEYHGNPVDAEKGSLVFYDYGWDVLDYCKRAGFKDCRVMMYYGYYYGYLGMHFLFVAEK